ncbi:hypothetical protein [Halorarius halobius]|uniref:hypothetical protein n=1 Tax=Halorarius halobius TaxID=2962671 RepID=UPI0020CC4041|nr:hypothetical protein [Halorarius halobius]
MSAPNPIEARASETTTGGPPSRYDLVFVVIPLAFAVGASDLAAFPEAMLFASVCGAAAMADALFVNPPGFR